MAETFDDFLVDVFPESSWRATVIGVREGVALAEDLLSGTHWLASQVGHDLRGQLRRAGVMWRFNQLCAIGDLPFRCREVENTVGNSHLLEVQAGKVRAHITKTESEGAFPTDSPLRQDHRLSNTADLFSDGRVVPITELIEQIPFMYAWLTFGADKRGNLTHVCWGAPDAKKNVWLAHINILRKAMSMPASTQEDQKAKKPDPVQAMKFKKHVEDQIKKNDEKSDGSGEG